MMFMVAQIKMNPRWQEILDILPKHHWNVTSAAIEVGYAKTYAERKLKVMLLNDVQFCSAMNKMREKITAKAMNEIERLQAFFTEITEDESQSMSTRLNAADKLAKMLGVYSEKRVYEDNNRARELDIEEKRQAQLISSTMLALPAPAYSESQDIVGDGSHSGTPLAPNNTETGDKQDGNNSDQQQPGPA